MKINSFYAIVIFIYIIIIFCVILILLTTFKAIIIIALIFTINFMVIKNIIKIIFFNFFIYEF